MEIEFDFCYQFFKEADKSSSMTWTVSHCIIEIDYFYNGLDLMKMFETLSEMAINLNLSSHGW